MTAIQKPILHIIVIGFHHKKGCQVEFCYPEVVQSSPNELPSSWKHLPALALPDGSHNYLSDTVYFHLPGLTHPAHTVFAVSCFRQIAVEQVTQRTADMTRSSVQKSVCVLSTVPLFGRLAIKMELVVKAWFRQGDFSKTKLLEDAYRHLNNCPIHMDQIYEGLSAVSFVEQWRHKAVLLFKLILLQRKVVLYGSPAAPLTSCLLTLLSLLPGCLQAGLNKSANIVLSRPLSPINLLVGDINETQSGDTIDGTNGVDKGVEIFEENDAASNINVLKDKKQHSFEEIKSENVSAIEKNDMMLGREKCHSVGEKSKINKTLGESQSNPAIAREMSVEGLNSLFTNLNLADCGFPLSLFEDGCLCLPYLSLQYLDVLADPAVKGFVIGASNILFKQKRQLFDILIEATDMRIETADLILRRQLQLTTEDLRFADHIMRHGPSQGDIWIRDQFGGYLIYLLKTSLLPDGSREVDCFNASFIAALKMTLSYQKWLNSTSNGSHEIFSNITAGHPFSGQLSVTDMKLRLTHTMTNTDGGRKVTQAVLNTGRAVATTSRAVGGVLSQAKGALSVWWSTLTTSSPQADNPLQSGEILDAHEALQDCDIKSDNSIIHDEMLSVQPEIITMMEEPIPIFHDTGEKTLFSNAEEALEPKTARAEIVTFCAINSKDKNESDNVAEDALHLLTQVPSITSEIKIT